MELKKFKINKLHESLNYELLFDDNTLILLGENGACKTTIIKMMYYTLSLQWKRLNQYNFESIEVTFGGIEKSFVIRKKDLQSLLSINDRALRRLPPSVRRSIIEVIEKGSNWKDLEEVCMRYGIPIEYIYHELNIDVHPTLYPDVENNKKSEKRFLELMNGFRNAVGNTHILYLPTYRRIEQELRVILRGKLDDDEYGRHHLTRTDENYTELIEFGMKDVDSKIDKNLTELKDSSRENLNQLTLSYLGDIVDEKYNKVKENELKNIDDATIRKIMDRVDETILSENRKEKLSATLRNIKEKGIKTDHDKVVCHYFLKLYESHKELEDKESTITDFANVCNHYLENKKAVYDSPSFDFRIVSLYDNKKIELQQLSSGEKQVVSLFSHLYLSHKKNYVVLIDEPEMSLSVKWQKMFLEDVRKGGFCSGLVAVTHSPFIFENGLDRFAHGLEEFKK